MYTLQLDAHNICIVRVILVLQDHQVHLEIEEIKGHLVGQDPEDNLVQMDH